MSLKFLVSVVGFFYLGAVPVNAHDSERTRVPGDEMSDAIATSSISKMPSGSCMAERPTAMTTARGFNILSAIGPKATSASEATP